MIELCRLIWCALIGFFRSRASLEAEIVVLRHQLNILGRKSQKRPRFGNFDRLILAGLYGLAPDVLSALAIVGPESVIRWHRRGLRLYWRWKSKSLGGRPKLSADIRQLIRDITRLRACVAIIIPPFSDERLIVRLVLPRFTTSTAPRFAPMSRQQAEKGGSSTSSWPLAGRVHQ
jgi:hypothetical protein